MKKIDPNAELLHMVELLDLRAGDIVLDAQTEADHLLRFAHDRTGDRGRLIGMAFGQNTFKEAAELVDSWGISNIQLMIGHPSMPVNLKQGLCHGLILRSTHGIPRLNVAINALDYLAKPGARILLRHTEWNTHLPKATEREQEMLAALKPQCVQDGQDFFRQAVNPKIYRWRDVRYDVYTVANRDSKASVRYNYDWRRMVREQLGKARVFTPREILDLIDRLEQTRGAKVSVDRYLALAIKP